MRSLQWGILICIASSPLFASTATVIDICGNLFTGDSEASGSCTFTDINGTLATTTGTASAGVSNGVMTASARSDMQYGGELGLPLAFYVDSTATAVLDETLLFSDGTGAGMLDAHFDLYPSYDEDNGSTAWDVFNGVGIDGQGECCLHSMEVMVPFTFGVPFHLTATLVAHASDERDGASASAEADLTSLTVTADAPEPSTTIPLLLLGAALVVTRSTRGPR